LDCKSEDAIVVVMQRLHVDDLVGRLLEQGGWTRLNLPAIAEAPQVVPLGPGRCHRRQAGEVLHPEREPLAMLYEMRRWIGSLDFAAQYQQALDGLRVLRRAAEIPRRRGELDDLDLRGTAYDGLLQKPAALGSQRLRAGT
jgi:hypothetical protein